MVAQDSSSGTGAQNPRRGANGDDASVLDSSNDGSKEQLQVHALPETHEAAVAKTVSAEDADTSSSSTPQRRHTPAPIDTSAPLAGRPPSARDAPIPTSASTASISASSVAASLTSARSPSPSRRQAFAARKLDPLLANLSPMATLEALKASDAVDRHASSQHRLLAESIAHVSPKERALGIRAAVAGKMLREWCVEVEGWEKGGFTIAGAGGKVKGGHATSGIVGHYTEQEFEYDVEYWGSLPATTVVDHERRLDDIQDEMEALELEELKTYVRKAHLLTRSRGDSSSASTTTTRSSKSSAKTGPPDAARKHASHRPSSSYTKLDDFTVVITATIMQLLPYLSKLSTLIELWQTRLLVLRRVPRFLQLLQGASGALSEANDAISGDREFSFSRENFYTTRDVLLAKNNALTETLDSMLDILEGTPDSIPDTWIDDMEILEVKYQDWVGDAEDTIMNNILGAAEAGQQSAGADEMILESIEEDDDGEEGFGTSRRFASSDDWMEPAGETYYSEEGLEEIQEVDETEEAEDSVPETGRAELHEMLVESVPDFLDRYSSRERGEDYDDESDPDSAGGAAADESDNELNDEEHDSQAALGQRRSIPRIDVPDKQGSPDTMIQAQRNSHLSSKRSSAQTAFRDSGIIRTRDSLGHLRHLSATYSMVSASPELNTADAVEYFGAPSPRDVNTSPSLKPSLLDIGPKSNISKSGKSSRDPSPSAKSVLLGPIHKRSVSVMSQSSSIKSQSASVKRVSALTMEPSESDQKDNFVDDDDDEVVSDLGDSDREQEPGIGYMDFAGAAIAEQLAVFEAPPAYGESDEDADVEDTDTADESFEGFAYSPTPEPPRSSGETRARSFHTRSSSGMMPNGRSRASTLNTYATWSDHSDSEGDVEGGLQSYRRASQLPVLQEATQSQRKDRVLQAQGDPSFSYDDVFDSLVQPLSSPSSPSRFEQEQFQTFSEEVDDTSSVRERVDFTKRPSIPAMSSIYNRDSPSAASSRLPRPNPPRTRRHHSENLRIDSTKLANIHGTVSAERSSPQLSQLQPQTVRHHSDDHFTQRISNVLSRIPAPIRLYSNPDLNDADELPTPHSRSQSISQPLSPMTDEPPGSPITDPRTPLNSNPPEVLALPLRLAPAFASPKASNGSGAGNGSYFPTVRTSSVQSEIKLYHLHQPGRPEPIKLYVRLVGEGSGRVMVRVGGGWSDLEEYLKEYAMHHGRSASISTYGTGPAAGAVAGVGAATGIEVHEFGTRTSTQAQPAKTNTASSTPASRPRDTATATQRQVDKMPMDRASRTTTPAHSVQTSRAASQSRSVSESPAQPSSSAPMPTNLPVHSKDYVSRARRHVSAGAYLSKGASASKIASPSSATQTPAPDSPANGAETKTQTVTAPGAASSGTSTPSPKDYAAWLEAEKAKDRELQMQQGRSRKPSSASMPLGGWSEAGMRPMTPGSYVAGSEMGSGGLGPAGPASMNKDISPRKRAWVEGVMRQARRVSGTGRSISGPISGPMGLGGGNGGRPDSSGGGGVKRVFLRRTSLSKRRD